MIRAAYLAMCCSCGGADVLWLLYFVHSAQCSGVVCLNNVQGSFQTGQLIPALHITPANSLFKLLCVNNVEGESAHLTCANFITVNVLLFSLGAHKAAYCL